MAGGMHGRGTVTGEFYGSSELELYPKWVMKMHKRLSLNSQGIMSSRLFLL